MTYSPTVEYQARKTPLPSLYASEKEMFSSLDLETGGSQTNNYGMKVHEQEILQAFGEEQAVDLVAVPRKSAKLRRASMSDSSHSFSNRKGAKMTRHHKPVSPLERFSIESNHSTPDKHDSADISTACPSKGSPASSISSRPSSDSNCYNKSTSIEQAGSPTRSTRTPLCTHKQEVLRVFGEHAEVTRNHSSKKKHTEHYKQEVLQVFGEDICGNHELVAVLREPAMSRQNHIDAYADEQQRLSLGGQMPSQEISDSIEFGERFSKRCPVLLWQAIVSCRRHKNLSHKS
jgi:hypothetical protein